MASLPQDETHFIEFQLKKVSSGSEKDVSRVLMLLFTDHHFHLVRTFILFVIISGWRENTQNDVKTLSFPLKSNNFTVSFINGRNVLFLDKQNKQNVYFFIVPLPPPQL